MEKKALFKEKTTDYYSTVKYSLPNVVEGSVLIIKYIKSSPYYTSIPSTYFQRKIPVNKMSIDFQIPEFFNYKMQTRGDMPIKINESFKSDNIVFTHKYTDYNGRLQYDNNQVDYTTKVYKAKISNVSPYTKEPFIDNVYNYISTLEFFLTSIQYPIGPIQKFAYDWSDVIKKKLKNKYIKGEITKRNYFKKELKELIPPETTYSKKVDNIYEFVKNKMNWNKQYKSLAYSGVKSAYNSKKGSSGDINIILLSMLKDANIRARPVFIISKYKRRSIFPNYNAFDYVIVEVTMPNNSKLYLDATDKNAKAGVLPLRVICGVAKVLTDSEKVIELDLSPKISQENTKLTYTIDSEGGITGGVKKDYIDYQSYLYRKNHKKDDNEALEALKEKINIEEIKEYERNGYEDPRNNLSISYKFTSDDKVTLVGDEIYFSPLLFIRRKNNPFKLEQRKFPINYGYSFSKTKIINITIPKAYQVISFPKDNTLKLFENTASFSFSFKTTNNKIQITVKEQLNQEFIDINKYSNLKEFVNQIVKKQNEQIVLKKI